ncbi:hypothetical protein [Spirulina sp. 06S082]|uniref:hypothetical protein n=1 Tax=Spirulina sp. 06S082 TaxID=3110248 RepID=UPI002B20B37E|nr:hypothetical protein [Spirulina sp. 06S082]MEA5468700.1 hypothetical protein [Spirulina sp. 06S082]
MTTFKPFVGLNRYEIGIPLAGYSYLFINLNDLKDISPSEAIAKLEAMGYDPQLRYMRSVNGLEICLLLKTLKLRSLDDKSPFGDEWETLVETLGTTNSLAVRCSTGRGKKAIASESDRVTVISA